MMESLFGSATPIWAGVTTSPIGAPVTLRAPEPVNYAASGLTGGFDGPAAPTVGSLLAAVAVRRGQPAGPASDAELEDFLYDCLEFLPGTGDVDIRCESGRVTFAGSVTHKRQKRDVGEIAWSIPIVNDVQNNVTIAARRRARAQARETEAHAATPARKSA
jgi:hypothetical protein